MLAKKKNFPRFLLLKNYAIHPGYVIALTQSPFLRPINIVEIHDFYVEAHFAVLAISHCVRVARKVENPHPIFVKIGTSLF